MIEPLQPPDSFLVAGVVGWTELGNYEEAALELARISPANQDHPDVLEASWMLQAAKPDWAQALEVADRLQKAAPERASGWLHKAYAARRVPGGGLEAAWQILHAAADLFPEEHLIPYNLSCYACQMNRLEEARAWLKRAFAGENRSRYRKLALADEDLRPLWPEVDSLCQSST